MKALHNVNARNLDDAVRSLQAAKASGRRAMLAGGGSDLIGLIKDHIVAPDVIVHLGKAAGLSGVRTEGDGVTVGGLTTLAALAADPLVRARYPVLAEAAEAVATPQIRGVGTLAGNVCQRPWCWYYRNGFPCFKAGGQRCFTPTGENQQHVIFGGGPSYAVHPSDTAPALVALGASFRVVGPSGPRTVEAADFFTLPRQDASRENVLTDDEILAAVLVPAPAAGVRSTYAKVMDREAWTHAVVSAAVVLRMEGAVCREARIVLGGVAPIPWRVSNAEGALVGQTIDAGVARRCGEAAIAGARPLAKNRYKVPMTKALVERTVLRLATGA